MNMTPYNRRICQDRIQPNKTKSLQKEVESVKSHSK